MPDSQSPNLSTFPEPLATALRTALDTFPGTHPMLPVWRDYPHVPPRDNELTDWWACREASQRFVAFLAARGITARCVHAEDSLTPCHDDHWWVRVTVPASGDRPGRTVNVDWTARQFHNLAHPPDPAHADLPFPLVWTDTACPDDHHPVTGRYAQVTDPAHTHTSATDSTTDTAA